MYKPKYAKKAYKICNGRESLVSLKPQADCRYYHGSVLFDMVKVNKILIDNLFFCHGNTEFTELNVLYALYVSVGGDKNRGARTNGFVILNAVKNL